MPTRLVRLIHWNAAEAGQLAERLKAAGYQAAYAVPVGLTFLREMRQRPPSAVVIDLSRLPSQGRDIALAIRHTKATRHLPLVLVGGAPEKVAMVQQSLPDAVYTTWDRIRGALKEAIAHPPVDPAVPSSVLAGYSGRPLVKKLGIKPNSVVGLVGAPPGFRETLGNLPAEVVIRHDLRGRCDLIVWFVRSQRELRRGMRGLAARSGRGGLWIAWPKRSSGEAADLTQLNVRRTGLDAGLVDYKISAIDATWSGLLFTRRKPEKA